MKHQKLFVFISIVLTLLFVASPVVYAANCQTGAKVASDLWKTYDDEAKKVGCVVGTGAAVILSGGMELPKAVKIYSKCLQKTDKADKIARNVVQQWNDLVNNNWATIGPRKLEMNDAQSGTIRSQGTRMFVTPTPVSDALEIAITKERFRGKTRVTVCKYAPSGPGLNANGDKIWEFTVGKGLGNKGKTWRRKFGNVAGHIVSVSLKGQSLVKSMKYNVEAKPLTTVIVNGSEKSGSADYTIKVSGNIEQSSGSLNGVNVSVQGNDNVRGNTAKGAVGAGNDGFLVDGEVRDIQLSNANGANVYVGGQPYSVGGGAHTVVIDSRNVQGDTNYTLNFSGSVEKVDGRLDGHKVSANAHDKIKGDTVEGYVGAGGDGLRVQGDVRGVALKNPNNAKVYIDGKEYGASSNTIVIDSRNISGATNYTLEVTGSVKKVANSLDGHSVSANAHDKVRGKTVKGYVGAGGDGYEVNGQIRDIQLDNPNAAKVYVNGQEWTG